RGDDDLSLLERDRRIAADQLDAGSRLDDVVRLRFLFLVFDLSDELERLLELVLLRPVDLDGPVNLNVNADDRLHLEPEEKLQDDARLDLQVRRAEQEGELRPDIAVPARAGEAV